MFSYTEKIKDKNISFLIPIIRTDDAVSKRSEVLMKNILEQNISIIV